MLLQGASQQEQERFAVYEPYINFLGRVDSTEFVDAKADVPESATALVGEAKILVPLAGLIDKDAEIARLTKDIEKSKRELQGIESKLGNKNFMDKAPAAVVEQSKTRQQELEKVIDELQEQLKKIEAL
jgi:valyl-tRNA synthetase